MEYKHWSVSLHIYVHKNLLGVSEKPFRHHCFAPPYPAGSKKHVYSLSAKTSISGKNASCAWVHNCQSQYTYVYNYIYEKHKQKSQDKIWHEFPPKDQSLKWTLFRVMCPEGNIWLNLDAV